MGSPWHVSAASCSDHPSLDGEAAAARVLGAACAAEGRSGALRSTQGPAGCRRGDSWSKPLKEGGFDGMAGTRHCTELEVSGLPEVPHPAGAGFGTTRGSRLRWARGRTSGVGAAPRPWDGHRPAALPRRDTRNWVPSWPSTAGWSRVLPPADAKEADGGGVELGNFCGPRASDNQDICHLGGEPVQ